MEMFTAIIIGVLSSIVASTIFLMALFRLRPRIEISPEISLQTDKEGNKVYGLKVINRTRRAILHVRCHLKLSEIRNVHGGQMIYQHQLKMKRDSLFQVAKFDKGDPKALYAIRFYCIDDLGKLWNDDEGTFLTFTIVATDSFSGFSKAFDHTFHLKRKVLKEGVHGFGTALTVS